MIETILIILAGLSLIAVIFFLTQYGLRIRQMNLKEEQEQRDLDHQNKLSNGYKYYEWVGKITRIHRNIYSYQETRRSYETKSGKGYFKSENDLIRWLSSYAIELTWFREL